MILNHKRRSEERAEAFKKRVKRNDDLQSAVKVPAPAPFKTLRRSTRTKTQCQCRVCEKVIDKDLDEDLKKVAKYFQYKQCINNFVISGLSTIQAPKKDHKDQDPSTSRAASQEGSQVFPV